MAKFYFGYSLIDNLQLESGLAYVENQSSYGIGTFFWGMGKGLNSDQRLLYSALQIPLHLKYTLPFKKSGLGMFFHAGIDLSIPLQRYKESSYMLQEHPEYKGSGDDYFYLMRSEYEVDVLAPKKIINCLVNAGIGFVYQFKCGIGVSIYTEYYSGLVDMARIRLQAETTVYETNGSKYTRLDPPQYIVFRGDYWHAGLGVSYTFKRKEKP
jgi:hypothetical protein